MVFPLLASRNRIPKRYSDSCISALNTVCHPTACRTTSPKYTPSGVLQIKLYGPLPASASSVQSATPHRAAGAVGFSPRNADFSLVRGLSFASALSPTLVRWSTLSSKRKHTVDGKGTCFIVPDVVAAVLPMWKILGQNPGV